MLEFKVLGNNMIDPLKVHMLVPANSYDCKTERIFTLDVQMTSLKLMFIQLSQLTRWPLYVSPFFNSTNLKRVKLNIICIFMNLK